MKHLIVTMATLLVVTSCRKEMGLPMNDIVTTSNTFFQRVKTQLKDSLSQSDFSKIDINQLFKSKDAQSDGYFVRGAFQKKDIATDFFLLKTDSLGNIRQGKIIHVNKANNNRSTKNTSFQGQVVIKSLNGSNKVTKEVVNGRWKKQSSTNSTMKAEEPAGEQELPEVVVTSYKYDGSYTGDWYWYDFFFDDYSYGGGGGYTYGSAGGGGSSYNDGSNDNTIIIEVESNDDMPIKVEDYVKCFSTVSDLNATYQVAIYSDIPVDTDPSEMFNWATTSPGHSFIQLTKSSGGISVQQNFGFYPKVGFKVLGNYPTESKIVDNGGHEFNASLTKTLSSTQFQTTINKLESLQTTDYDINTWNCTDFALSVYNASSYIQLSIPKYITAGSYELMNTPQGLYNEIKRLQVSGITTQGTPNVPSSAGKSGDSHGKCGE
ncbi:hypothetical protein FC093_17330 [Ilyomonas limi]|uniref:Uncharacterized protein n=1 Tax=Ilyomonas limi TaxID=2575867 RepID=A0A4U3KUW5_9BACT|nr:hypothetical protein [Ilyomonas limi]TKK66345.1 hypothetical protein FC093_17330 [Ilyomonas limi]